MIQWEKEAQEELSSQRHTDLLGLGAVRTERREEIPQPLSVGSSL